MESTKTELSRYCEGIKRDLAAIYNGDAKNDDGETVTLWDYFEDALDVEYTVNSQGEYIAARIYVTLGGPNVWVDTRDGYVKGAWGSDRAEVWLTDELRTAIDDIFSEYYDSIRR